MSATQSEQRLAWTGAGWLSHPMETLCKNSSEPFPAPPDLWAWADSGLNDLMRFDQALLEHCQNAENRVPHGYAKYEDYIRALCNFLPDHRSRLETTRWLSSNSRGEPGGPRAWQGILDGRLNMHLRHLLLDGWLTLWWVESEGKLYYQPGSLALLYWAAYRADMPHTQSPEAFLEGYDWSDPNWFGGHRRHWRPKG